MNHTDKRRGSPEPLLLFFVEIKIQNKSFVYNLTVILKKRLHSEVSDRIMGTEKKKKFEIFIHLDCL